MALKVQCLAKKQKVLDKVPLSCYSFDESNKSSRRRNPAASGMGCEALRVGHCDASFRERISQIRCGWMHSAGTGLRKILFRPRHVLWRGRVRPVLAAWGVSFFAYCAPIRLCFPRRGWGRAGKTISPSKYIIGSMVQKTAQVSRPPGRSFGKTIPTEAEFL